MTVAVLPPVSQAWGRDLAPRFAFRLPSAPKHKSKPANIYFTPYPLLADELRKSPGSADEFLFL